MEFSVSWVSERDIDLFLLHSLVTFLWFFSDFMKIIWYEQYSQWKIVFAWRSVTQSIGESDLEFLIESNDSTLCLMIENKINASVQPQQAERYNQRGENNILQWKCNEYITILVAPQTYLNGCDSFNRSISYETIVWLLQKNWDNYCFSIYMIEQAIAKSSVWYSPIADQPVTDFWVSYYHLVCDQFPFLNMKKPNNKPSTSSFIYFHPVWLPTWVTLVHKFVHWFFDIQLRWFADRQNEFQQILWPLLWEHTIERAWQSLVIRSFVPKIDPVLWFDKQYLLVVDSLQRWSHLLDFFLSSKEILSLIQRYD